MPAHVTVRDLRKSYGRTEAVRGVEFAVERGTIFGLLGPNGAGKTTTLECVIGLREPDGGRIEIDGIDAHAHPHEAKQKIGVALQSTSLPDSITPREALDLFGAFYRERIPTDALLERFALTERAQARVATLSGGERQRLALALAFVNRPDLVVLDEPTTGLDVESRYELRTEIRRLRGDGCTVLLSTHELAEAEELCDSVAIIDAGRIVAHGAPHTLAAAPGARQSISVVLEREVGAELWAKVEGVVDLTVEGASARFETKDATAALARLTALLAAEGGRIVSLNVGRHSLEETFLRLTREEARRDA